MPVYSGYRPNHNFGSADDAEMYIGAMEFQPRLAVYPGDSVESIVSFLLTQDFVAKIQVGTEWRIQEGKRLVAIAKVDAVMSTEKKKSL